MSTSVSDVIDKYMELRREKEAIERDAKAKFADLRSGMEKLEAWLMSKMDVEGVTSFKAKSGATAYKAKVDYAGVADWEELIEFIKKNNDYSLLEHRVSKQAVRRYLDMGEPPPPGVNYVTKVELNFRKPSES